MIDFSPRPGSATPAAMVWSHALTEARLLVRNGEQLLLALVLPVAILVGGRWVGPRLGMSFDELAPSVLALAIFSTAFTATAIATGFERRQGVLERLAATPLGRGGLVAGKALCVAMLIAGQLVLLTVLALTLGWRPEAGATQWLVVAVTSLGGTVGFVAWALVLAGTLRAELTLALANLLHLVAVGAGALLVNLNRYPPMIRQVVAFMPTSALGEAWRATSARHITLFSLPISLFWALVGVLVARKVFRWTMS